MTSANTGIISMIYNIIRVYYSDDKRGKDGKFFNYEDVADSDTIKMFLDEGKGGISRTLFLTRIKRDFEVISNDFEKKEIILISLKDKKINSIKNDMEGFKKFLDVTYLNTNDFLYYFGDCYAVYQQLYMESFEQVQGSLFNFKVNLGTVRLTFENINVLSSKEMDEVVKKVHFKKNELGFDM